MNVLPLWVSLTASALLIISGLLTLTGSIGLLRLKQLYERMHAPTLGMTMGTFCVLLASVLITSTLQNRPIFHELLITLFLIITSPVTAILLMQSAIHRQTPPD
ncbi:monovalent cation/H(+) antiporter subunit G [Alcaligenaceae bacterium CGII-47]|nr:monovalent cation/H(+) antiporter subunit G [Alcaligenaceae bacterium CGII-47]